jgi:hypothetical protein
MAQAAKLKNLVIACYIPPEYQEARGGGEGGGLRYEGRGGGFGDEEGWGTRGVAGGWGVRGF